MENSNTGQGNSIFNQFNKNQYVNDTTEFLNSNSLVAKIAFLLLVLFVFIILLRLGITLLGYFFSPSNNTQLINGMVDAKQLIVIPQDPSSEGSVTINRSVNANEGIEFTWSVWIYINDLTYNSGQYRCVFYKGNDYARNPNNNNQDTQGLNFPNNAPGLYVAPNSNSLIIMMNTFNVINEEIQIDNIPLNKWVNITFRIENKIMDVYVNGTISNRLVFENVPLQTYHDIQLCQNGGFKGQLSNLRYFSYSLNIFEINALVLGGPDLRPGQLASNINNISDSTFSYISNMWYAPNRSM